MFTKTERKLTTILAADAEGYSRRKEVNKVATIDARHNARDGFAKFIDRHNGRIANTAGDALIADFPSVVKAVKCGIEVQRELGQDQSTPGGALPFRIGIHLGDMIIDGNDLLGEGVNLAAVVFAILAVIDLSTGPGSYAQYSGIVLLVIVGWQAAPLFSDRFAVSHLRIAVVLAGLILINLITWDGSFWVMHVLFVVIGACAIRRITRRPQ
jgi:hypothetical protein